SGEIVLRLDDYRGGGGLAGALDKHGESIFQQLSAEQQRIAEVMFRALSERSAVRAARRDIRRPTSVQDIAEIAGVSVENVQKVADIFRKQGINFLTPAIEVALSPQTRLDITHESLLRRWERLRNWVEKEAVSAEIYHRLTEDAKLWQAGHHDFLGTAALSY